MAEDDERVRGQLGEMTDCCWGCFFGDCFSSCFCDCCCDECCEDCGVDACRAASPRCDACVVTCLVGYKGCARCRDDKKPNCPCWCRRGDPSFNACTWITAVAVALLFVGAGAGTLAMLGLYEWLPACAGLAIAVFALGASCCAGFFWCMGVRGRTDRRADDSCCGRMV